MNGSALSRQLLVAAGFHAVRRRTPPQGRFFRVTAAIPAAAGHSCIREAANRLEDGCLDGLLPQTDDVAVARYFMLQPCKPAFVVVRSRPGSGVLLGGGGQAMSVITQRLEAAHYLPRVPARHRCRQLHGHSYVLQCILPAGLASQVAPQLAALRDKLDKRCLNDIPGLDNPTCEMLTAWLWQQLPGISGIAVRETPSCGCFHDGSNFFVWRDIRMESALRSETDCYGHSYRARFYLKLPLQPDMGWTMDFGDMRQQIAPLRQRLDHSLLSELPGLERNTAEALPEWLYQQIEKVFPELVRLELEAAPGTGALLSRGGPACLPPAETDMR